MPLVGAGEHLGVSLSTTTEAPVAFALPRLRVTSWMVVLAISGALLYFSLRGIDWAEVWHIVRGARLELVALTMVLNSIALFSRSFRWRVLLQACCPVPVSTAFWATAAGYLGNNVLPARAGEVIRTLMISRRTGANTAFVLTTALSERVVDAAVLITITATVLLTLPEKPSWLDATVRPFAILGLVSVLGLTLLPSLKDLGLRWLARMPLPAALLDKLAGIVEQAVAGIEAFHHRGRLVRFLMLTALIWFLDGLITVVGARAIGVPITFSMAFLLVAGLGLGSAIPSTPGYLGVYQFVAVTILTPFGLSRSEAVAYILLFQATNYVVVGVWGVLGMVRLPMRAG